jgi:hypothetical protein
VREATEAELAAVPGLGPAQARAVHAFFHPSDVPEELPEGQEPAPAGPELAPGADRGESGSRRRT